MKNIRILLFAAVLFFMTDSLNAEQGGKLGLSFDATYMSRWMPKGKEGYGTQGAVFENVYIDLWDTGFGVAIGHQNATSEGYVDKQRLNYKVYFNGVLFNESRFQTKFKACWIYKNYYGKAANIGNTQEWATEMYRIHELPLGGEPPNVAEAIQFYHPEDRPRVSAIAQRAMENGEDFDFEARLITAKNNLIWVRAIGYGVFDEGRPVGLRGTIQDITERKRAEEKLRNSEERFRRFATASGYGFAMGELSGQLLFANAATLRIVEEETEEAFTNKTFYQYYISSDAERIRHEILPIVMEKGQWAGEIPLLSARGNLVATSQNIFLIRDEQGIPRMVGNIITDITERKRAEEELLRYACIVSNSNDMMAILDNNFVYLGANDAYLASFGMSKDEVIGHTVAEVFGEEFFEAIMKPNAKRCLEGNRVSYENWFEFPVHGLRFMSVSYSPYIGPDGEIRGFVVNAKDITERKRAEEALQEEEELARACLDASNDMVYLVDTEGNVLTVNDIAARNFGMASDELVGTNIFSYFPPELAKSRRERGNEAVLSGKHVRFQDEREGKFYDISICPAFNVLGKVERLAVFVTDITERKLGEEEIFNYQEKLRSLASELSLVEERERRRLATELHDNTSQELALSLIKLQTVRKSVGESSHKALDDVCESLQKTSLDVRNLTFELCSPTLYNFGLETAITELLEDRLGKAGDISYNFHDDKKPKPLSEDVKITLFQAVRELLTNITKHAQAQNVLVNVTKADSKVKIAINDDGAGFDVDKMESHDRPKSGFGLFNVKERLGHIGGNFKIKSSPGKGTSIVLEAPLQ